MLVARRDRLRSTRERSGAWGERAEPERAPSRCEHRLAPIVTGRHQQDPQPTAHPWVPWRERVWHG